MNLIDAVVFGGLLFPPTAPLGAAVATQLAGPAVVVVIMAHAGLPAGGPPARPGVAAHALAELCERAVARTGT